MKYYPPWEPTFPSFLEGYDSYDPYFKGLKPSCFMGFGVQGQVYGDEKKNMK